MLSFLFAAALSLIDVSQPPYNIPPNAGTDVAPAIQSVLDAAGTQTVYIPSGTYELRANLLLNNKQVIIGDGNTTVMRRLDNNPTTSTAVFSPKLAGTRDFVYLANMTLETTDDPNAVASGIQIGQPANGWVLENLVFKNFRYHGLRTSVTGVVNLVVNACEFINIHQDSTASGIAVSHISDAVFSNNYFHDTGSGTGFSWGIYASGNVYRLRFTGNRFEDMHAGGIRILGNIADSSDFVVVNNSFENTGITGGAGVSVQAIYRLRVANNVFSQFWGGGISIQGDTQEYLIENNTFSSDGLLDYSGVVMTGGNQKGRIEHNDFLSAARTRGAAISVFSGDDISIAFNHIENIKHVIWLREGVGGSFGTNIRIDGNYAYINPAAPDMTPGDGVQYLGIWLQRATLAATVYPNVWQNYVYDTYRP